MEKTIKRLFFSFIIIYILNFFIPRLLPGDPFSHSAVSGGEEMNGLNQAEIARMEKYYDLDKPLYIQFVDTFKKNISGDLGNSILYKKPVNIILKDRFIWTLYLMLSSLLISLLLAVVLSLISVYNKKTGDILYKFMSVICEIPAFIIGIMLLFLVAAKVSWIPLSGNLTPFTVYNNRWDHIKDIMIHSFMPILSLILFNLPGFYFTAESSLRNTMKKRYISAGRIRTVKSKDLLNRYIIKNSMIPVLSKFFLSIGNVLGATIIVENVFSYPGIGMTMREAMVGRDYILLQGIFLISSLIVLFSIFISDYLVKGMDRYI